MRGKDAKCINLGYQATSSTRTVLWAFKLKKKMAQLMQL